MRFELKEFRCGKCNTLMFKFNIDGDNNHSTIQVKCRRCNTFNVLDFIGKTFTQTIVNRELDALK